MLSPSMRREWIEMTHLFPLPGALLSPSMRREWIEMCYNNNKEGGDESLPPCGGSGLKFIFFAPRCRLSPGLPPCGGSGLKYHFSRYFQSFKNTPSLPPCGGSGLKCFQPGTILDMQWSPSMRREWIEIYLPGNA